MQTIKTAQEARSFLRQTSISPINTIGIGISATLIIMFLGWVIFTDRSIENLIFSAVASILLIFVPGLKKVGIAKCGIIILFGKRVGEERFEAGEEAILSEGWHWLPPKICKVLEVDIKERSVTLDSVEVIVRDPNDPKVGFIVVFKNIQVNYIPFSPLRITNTGEQDIDKELKAVAGEAIREKGINLQKTLISTAGSITQGDIMQIFAEDVDEHILKKIDNQSDTDRWGIVVVSAKTPTIEFLDPNTKKAFEASFVESKQRESEKFEAETLADNTKMFIEMGIDKHVALMTAERRTGKLRPSDIVIFRQGTPNNGSTVGEDVIAAQIVAQNKPQP